MSSHLTVAFCVTIWSCFNIMLTLCVCLRAYVCVSMASY